MRVDPSARPVPGGSERDYLYSTHRERMIEHLFLSRLLREAWSQRGTTIDVLRPEVDASGYDLLLEHRGMVRHVQLKASRKGSRTRYQTVHKGLAEKPGGCVLWIEFVDDRHEEKMGLRYRFFGGTPTMSLDLSGFRIAKKTTHRADGVRGLRSNVRKVPRGRFRELRDISVVYDTLFPNSGPNDNST